MIAARAEGAGARRGQRLAAAAFDDDGRVAEDYLTEEEEGKSGESAGQGQALQHTALLRSLRAFLQENAGPLAGAREAAHEAHQRAPAPAAPAATGFLTGVVRRLRARTRSKEGPLAAKPLGAARQRIPSLFRRKQAPAAAATAAADEADSTGSEHGSPTGVSVADVDPDSAGAPRETAARGARRRQRSKDEDKDKDRNSGGGDGGGEGAVRWHEQPGLAVELLLSAPYCATDLLVAAETNVADRRKVAATLCDLCLGNVEHDDMQQRLLEALLEDLVSHEFTRSTELGLDINCALRGNDSGAALLLSRVAGRPESQAALRGFLDRVLEQDKNTATDAVALADRILRELPGLAPPRAMQLALRQLSVCAPEAMRERFVGGWLVLRCFNPVLVSFPSQVYSPRLLLDTARLLQHLVSATAWHTGDDVARVDSLLTPANFDKMAACLRALASS